MYAVAFSGIVYNIFVKIFFEESEDLKTNMVGGGVILLKMVHLIQKKNRYIDCNIVKSLILLSLKFHDFPNFFIQKAFDLSGA